MKELLPCPEDDPKVNVGVLTSDEIKYCVEAFKLIDPFDERLVWPARYKLTLGKDYAIGGKRKSLSEESGKDILQIPPFQVAIVSTREKINLPRFLIARWNLDIKLVYKGLLWVGGPQVDPGWCGRLLCPLYNLSDKPVRLQYGEIVATIDFARTTPFKKGVSKEYPRPPVHEKFDDYDTSLQSALFVKVQERLEKFDEEMKEQRNVIERFSDKTTTLALRLFTIIGIVIAAISLVVAKGDFIGIPWWGWISTILSITALLLTIFPALKKLLDPS